jgi:Tfp pilus assembly protein PilO
VNNRIIAFAALLLSGAIVALGWFLGVQPRLADAAAAEAERENVVATNEGLEVQLAQLKKEFEQIDDLRAEVAELRASIPGDADYSGFVAELNGLSGATGAGVTRLSIGDASWYANAAAEQPPAAETPAPPAGSASADGASTPVADGSPVQIPIDSSLVNGSNFVAIPVTIELSGDYAQATALMGALQKDKRLFLVTGFAFGGAAPPRIDGLLYVLLTPAG